jgi:hypothetical protein
MKYYRRQVVQFQRDQPAIALGSAGASNANAVPMGAPRARNAAQPRVIPLLPPPDEIDTPFCITVDFEV